MLWKSWSYSLFYQCFKSHGMKATEEMSNFAVEMPSYHHRYAGLFKQFQPCWEFWNHKNCLSAYYPGSISLLSYVYHYHVDVRLCPGQEILSLRVDQNHQGISRSHPPAVWFGRYTSGVQKSECSVGRPVDCEAGSPRPHLHIGWGQSHHHSFNAQEGPIFFSSQRMESFISFILSTRG